MTGPRVFRVADHLRLADGEPVRSVVHETADASAVAWIVKPGQRIVAHVHPHGADTWTIVAGQGAYQTEASGASVPIAAGDIVIASSGEVHGVLNNGIEALVFVAVVSPALAGFEPL